MCTHMYVHKNWKEKGYNIYVQSSSSSINKYALCMYVYQWESAPTSAARSTHAVMYEKRLYPYPFPISQEDSKAKKMYLGCGCDNGEWSSGNQVKGQATQLSDDMYWWV